MYIGRSPNASSVCKGFIDTPSSVNATLGSRAKFTCSICEDFISWLVNGSKTEQLINTVNINGVKSSTLSILVSEDFNNSMIECGYYSVSTGERNYTKPVTLQVQG